MTALASRLGVPGPGLLDALRGNPLASPYAIGKITKMLEQDDEPDFSLDMALKDLDLATSEGGNGGCSACRGDRPNVGGDWCRTDGAAST